MLLQQVGGEKKSQKGAHQKSSHSWSTSGNTYLLTVETKSTLTKLSQRNIDFTVINHRIDQSLKIGRER